MNNLFIKIKNGLIVSCQSEGDDPFNSPEGVTLFAKAAFMGGAVAIRSEGIEKIRSIKKAVNLPIIGLLKSTFPDGYVRITGSYHEVEQLLEAGCDMIAVDGTFRERERLNGPDFIERIKSRYSCMIMADIATINEAFACENSGADCISTTLNGYTPETISKNKNPNFNIIKQLVQKKMKIPVIAEGRINKPADAKRMLENGAWAVVAGTAITRPRVITQWYVNEINRKI